MAQLEPVWTLSTGVAEGHEVTAIVNEGTMFITTPENQVLAVDTRTGELPWRYRHPALPRGSGTGHRTPASDQAGVWGGAPR